MDKFVGKRLDADNLLNFISAVKSFSYKFIHKSFPFYSVSVTTVILSPPPFKLAFSTRASGTAEISVFLKTLKISLSSR